MEGGREGERERGERGRGREEEGGKEGGGGREGGRGREVKLELRLKFIFNSLSLKHIVTNVSF